MRGVVDLVLAAAHLKVGAPHVQVVLGLLVELRDGQVTLCKLFAWFGLHAVAIFVTTLETLGAVWACCDSAMGDLDIGFFGVDLGSWVEGIFALRDCFFLEIVMAQSEMDAS